MSMRIRRGFNRLALFGFVPFCGATTAALVVGAYLLLGGRVHDARAASMFALAFFFLGGLWWTFWAGVGWVISGFWEDTEPKDDKPRWSR